MDKDMIAEYQDYNSFLERRRQIDSNCGFEPLFVPDYLFDFQKALVEWSVKRGRAAIFADCGLGKSIMELVWAENIIKKTNGNVLLLTPLAVGRQMLKEAEKFGIKAGISREGEVAANITISNYERLHYFKPEDFDGVVLDESSILKNFNGATKNRINIFMRKIHYRLLATATAAPNDFIELGTSSEALGYLGYMDMLGKFFKNDHNSCGNLHGRFEQTKWRLKGHAYEAFWRWTISWARSIRKPSDLGFDDDGFILPDLKEHKHKLKISRPSPGMLFTLPAMGLKEVRDERKATVQERCEKAADLVNKNEDYAVVWCNLNTEGDLLESLISDSIQVSGNDDDDKKADKLWDFSSGNSRVLITKPKIGAWGLNWQHCNHITFFPNYSYEQYYQAVRRCWRFGQKREVNVELIYTQGDEYSLGNLLRKQRQADEMFENLIHHMNNALHIDHITNFNQQMEIPAWL